MAGSRPIPDILKYSAIGYDLNRFKELIADVKFDNDIKYIQARKILSDFEYSFFHAVNIDYIKKVHQDVTAVFSNYQEMLPKETSDLDLGGETKKTKTQSENPLDCLEAARRFIKKSISSDQYDLYTEVCHKYRKQLHKNEIDAKILIAAAKSNVQMAFLVIGSTLCLCISPPGLLSIYQTHRKSDQFVDFIKNGKYPVESTLKTLVENKYQRALDAINSSPSMMKLYQIQIKRFNAQYEFKKDKEHKSDKPDPEQNSDVRLLRRLKLNPHEILEISKDAKPTDIKKSYRKLSMQYHPDKIPHQNPNKIMKEIEATERFKILTSAYNVMMDNDLRKVFELPLLEELNKKEEEHRKRPGAGYR